MIPDIDAIVREAKAEALPQLATIRGTIMMAALVVMSEVDEVDNALASAIASKAAADIERLLQREAAR